MKHFTINGCQVYEYSEKSELMQGLAAALGKNSEVLSDKDSRVAKEIESTRKVVIIYAPDSPYPCKFILQHCDKKELYPVSDIFITDFTVYSASFVWICFKNSSKLGRQAFIEYYNKCHDSSIIENCISIKTGTTLFFVDEERNKLIEQKVVNTWISSEGQLTHFMRLDDNHQYEMITIQNGMLYTYYPEDVFFLSREKAVEHLRTLLGKKIKETKERVLKLKQSLLALG